MAKKTTKMKSAKQDASASLGFEEKLWLAADKLRGSIDAAEYKHVVLGLLFLKYISDAFQARREELEALCADPKSDYFTDGDADWTNQTLEDRDEYASKNVYWVPPEARWSQLQAKRPDIAKLIDDGMYAIERDNPRLKNVLPRDYGKPGSTASRKTTWLPFNSPGWMATPWARPSSASSSPCPWVRATASKSRSPGLTSSAASRSMSTPRSARFSLRSFGTHDFSTPITKWQQKPKRSKPDMGVAPGGRLRQQIFADEFDPEDWDTTQTCRCFIHLCNSLQWKALTGQKPPSKPISPREYRKAGLPWFQSYKDKARVLDGSAKLASLETVADHAQTIGETPLIDEQTVSPEHIASLEESTGRGELRNSV